MVAQSLGDWILSHHDILDVALSSHVWFWRVRCAVGVCSRCSIGGDVHRRRIFACSAIRPISRLVAVTVSSPERDPFQRFSGKFGCRSSSFIDVCL